MRACGSVRWGGGGGGGGAGRRERKRDGVGGVVRGWGCVRGGKVCGGGGLRGAGETKFIDIKMPLLNLGETFIHFFGVLMNAFVHAIFEM